MDFSNYQKKNKTDNLYLFQCINPLDCKGYYSATSNSMKLVHWPLMGGLLHLVQGGGY